MSADLLIAFVAGLVTLLNPCVLPVLPIVVGSAFLQGRLGPLALGAGLALSFTLFGTLIAATGAVAGLEQALLRQIGAGLLLACGLVLLIPPLQLRLSVALAGVSGGAGTLAAKLPGQGLGGQAVLGVVLGAVWSPCVGPTLGAAIAAAATGESLGRVSLTMAAFGIGTATALAGFAYGSRAALHQRRDRLRRLSGMAKPIFGGLLVLVGLMILSGADKLIESALLDILPESWIAFTTRF